MTLATDVQLRQPVHANGEMILEPGADVVWFTFPGQWHDIGRFHDRRGDFTGWYANILTPVEIHPGGVWDTTDLFLDLWIHADRPSLTLLDEDQFDDALEKEWIEPSDAQAARAEVARLTRLFDEGAWPPPVTREWTLDRARCVSATNQDDARSRDDRDPGEDS